MIDNNRYEILTPTGFQDFVGMRKLNKDEYLSITFSSKKEIKCSLEHPFIINGSIVRANMLKVGDNVDCISEEKTILKIEYHRNRIELYDIIEVSNGNLFIANDVVTHNCDFLTSGHTVIDGEIIKWYLDRCSDPIEKRGLGMDYWLWKQPQYDRDYVVFADVARGDGNDNSSFQVVDVETLEQVAEFDGQMGTREFGNFLVAVATEWNTALLCVLNRNYGWEVVNQVIERGYPNLYYSYRHDPYLDPNIHLRKNVDLRDKSDKIPGFTETEPIRTTTVSKMETYLNEKSVKINSKRLVNQLLVFVWLNRKAQAAPGYKDDLVIAYMYQFYMHDIALKMRLMGIELTKRALTNTHKSVYRPKTIGIDPYKQRVGNTTESLTWLL